VREKELDGGAYYKLRPAAEALEDKYPAGATRLYRRMVESVLHRGLSKQYPYAARELQSCIRLAPRIADEADIEARNVHGASAAVARPQARLLGFGEAMTTAFSTSTIAKMAP
jgi:hypothetical protein